jgi:DNA primase
VQDHEFKDFVNRVKLAASIEDVVRTRVGSLKRAGRLYQACCPFHDEKTPSFKVDPERGTWRCYGACAEGGDVISFIQKADNAEFIEALKTAASFAGVPLPEGGFGKKKREDSDRYKPLYDVLGRAEKLYRRKLLGPEGAAARSYLTSRGLSPEVCEIFGVGWAPKGGSPLLDTATKAGIDASQLEECGLVRQREGRSFDFFYNRIVIPIRDDKGRTVGFGARSLPADGDHGPKYVNTPETVLFHKGRLIYGYDLALATLRREKRLVLVEGYTDVIAAHQAGFRTVAAVLGTATTAEHATLVRKSGVRRVTLVFDGDDAGARATQRALVGLLPLGIEIDVAPPPAGKDPADLCGERDGAAFGELLEAPVAWLDFLLGQLKGLAGRELSDAGDELFMVVPEVKTPVHRASLLAGVAGGLGIPAEDIRAQYDDLTRRRPSRAPQPASSGRGEPSPSPARPSGSGGHDAFFPAGPVDFMEVDGVAADDDFEPAFTLPQSNARRNTPQAASGRDRLREAQERNEILSWRQLVGALLADNGLVPRYLDPAGDDFFVNCPEPTLIAVVNVIRALYFEGPDDLELDAEAVAKALPEDVDDQLPGRLETLADHGVASDLAADSLRFIQEQDHLRAVADVRERLAAAETADERDALLVELAGALRARTIHS